MTREQDMPTGGHFVQSWDKGSYDKGFLEGRRLQQQVAVKMLEEAMQRAKIYLPYSWAKDNNIILEDDWQAFKKLME